MRLFTISGSRGTHAIFDLSNTSSLIVMNGDKVDLFASLCKIYETSEDELRKTIDKVNNLITEKLKKNSCLATECQTDNLKNIDTG